MKLSALQADAHHINSLLSDTRFCDVVASEIPSFPAHMVQVAVDLEKFDAPIHLMVRRVVIAMLNKPGSALFVENEWLGQGFIGNAKPITRSIFGNWHRLEYYELGLEAPLDLVIRTHGVGTRTLGVCISAWRASMFAVSPPMSG